MELDLDEDEDDGEEGFEKDALLEALPATSDGVFNLCAITEALTETAGGISPPADQRGPGERYMKRPDGHYFPPLTEQFSWKALGCQSYQHRWKDPNVHQTGS